MLLTIPRQVLREMAETARQNIRLKRVKDCDDILKSFHDRTEEWRKCSFIEKLSYPKPGTKRLERDIEDVQQRYIDEEDFVLLMSVVAASKETPDEVQLDGVEFYMLKKWEVVR